MTDPFIHKNVIDFDMLFDVGAGSNSCKRPFTNQTLDWNHDFGSQYLQIIVNDRVVNCIIDSMIDQNWGKITLSSEMMKRSFGTHLFPITARSVANAFPQIADIYGLDQELDIEIDVWRASFTFGPDSGNNCRLRLGIKFGIKKHGDLNYIIYDEVEYTTEFDLEIRAEVVYATFKETTLQPTPVTRTTPMFTTLDIGKS